MVYLVLRKYFGSEDPWLSQVCAIVRRRVVANIKLLSVL
jgi:hypothetical protein